MDILRHVEVYRQMRGDAPAVAFEAFGRAVTWHDLIMWGLLAMIPVCIYMIFNRDDM